MRAPAVNKLWIVEKPSMALALVGGLQHAQPALRVVNDPRRDGFHELSNGDAVCPLIGHVIEMELLEEQHRRATPDTYFSFLPLFVDKPRYKPKPDSPPPSAGKGGKSGASKPNRDGPPNRAYLVSTALLRKCREVVNAGDIDREGQRIVDELLEDVGIDPAGKTKPVWRLALVSTRAEDIARQLGSLERNGDPKWQLRGRAALTRQILDMVIGMNSSMALQSVTGRRNMSAGRVQTSVLQIVYDRDQLIENFKPRDYYVPVVMLPDGTEMRWHKRQDAEGKPGFDEEGRIIDRALAQQIVDRIARGLAGRVAHAEAKKHSQAPPLPFSNASLASTASRRFGMTPKEAEKAAQTLYERHKAISYVGTDCQFLPTSMHADARTTLQALARAWPGKAQQADVSLRSPAWNDAKVDEHFAIVPTGKVPDAGALSPAERQVYETVVLRYIAQFYPDHQYLQHSLRVNFEAGADVDEFRATSKEVVRMGWKEVEGSDDPGADAAAESGEQQERDGAADQGPRAAAGPAGPQGQGKR